MSAGRIGTRTALMCLAVLAWMALMAAPSWASSTPVSLVWEPATSGGNNYGTIDAGTSKSETFRLKNIGGTGSAALTITLANSSGSAFSVTSDGCTGRSLGPRKSCTVTAQFAPPAAGQSDSATLKATTSKTDASIALTGKSAASKASFTIEKAQRLEGQAEWRTAEIAGEFGKTVEYEVIVKDTGATPIKFSKLTDAGCEGISPGGAVELAPGGEQAYTCSHVLSEPGKYGNTATITGGAETKTSNEVVVDVPAKVTVLDEQRAQGSGNPFTTEPISAKVGDTIEYEVTVTNHGTESFKVEGEGFMIDLKGELSCQFIAVGTELKPAESAKIDCTVKLEEAGDGKAQAEVEGAFTGGSQVYELSNVVVANVSQ